MRSFTFIFPILLSLHAGVSRSLLILPDFGRSAALDQWRERISLLRFKVQAPPSFMAPDLPSGGETGVSSHGGVYFC